MAWIAAREKTTFFKSASPPPNTTTWGLFRETDSASQNNLSNHWRTRSEPSLAKFKVGQVLFLPPLQNIDIDSVCRKEEKDPQTYGHPAIVTSIHDNGNLGIMVVTSLGETSLTEKYQGRSDAHRYMQSHMYIACGTSEDARYRHPDSSMPELSLMGSNRFSKHSYVRYDREIMIESHHMRYVTLGGNAKFDMYLTAESVVALLARRGTGPRLHDNSNVRSIEFKASAKVKEIRRRSAPAFLESSWRKRA